MQAQSRRFSLLAVIAALIVGTVVTLAAPSAHASVSINAYVGDATVVEGNGPQTQGVVLPVQFSSPLFSPICISYSTVDGSATGAKALANDGTADFVKKSAVVKVDAGRTSAGLTSAVLYDTYPEVGAPETYTVGITSVKIYNGSSCSTSTTDAVNVLLTKGSGTVSIIDDDVVPEFYGVKIGDVSTGEGNGPNNTKVTLPLQLNNYLPFGLCVVWSTTNGSASGSVKPVHDGSADYVSAHGSELIPAFTTKASIGTVVLSDTVSEAALESYSVNITAVNVYNNSSCKTSTAPSGVEILRGTGTVYVVDDDTAPPVITAPHAPDNVRATVTDDSGDPVLVDVTWTAPYDGGSPIDGYTMVMRVDFGSPIELANGTATSPFATSCDVGHLCEWFVYAHNALGYSLGAGASLDLRT